MKCYLKRCLKRWVPVARSVEKQNSWFCRARGEFGASWARRVIVPLIFGASWAGRVIASLIFCASWAGRVIAPLIFAGPGGSLHR